jgi:outer membrane protein TolC
MTRGQSQFCSENMRAGRFRARGRMFAAVCALLLIAAAPAPAGAQDTGETLTLKRAVALAVQNSRELALARIQYSVAQNQIRVDRAEFRPNVYTGAGAVYSSGIPATPGGTAPSVFKLTYTEHIFDPLLSGQVHAAEDRAKHQQDEIERTRETVIYRAATTYLDLAKVRHELELLRNERASTQKILDYTRERSGAGLELPIEVTRAQLTVARIDHHIIQLETRDDVLAQQLRDQIGYPSEAPLQVAPEDLPAAAEESTNALEELAMQNNLDVKAAEKDRDARQHLFKGVHASYWPTIDLIGEYDLLSDINNYSRFYKTFQRNNVNFGVQVTIPLFAARTSAAVALAKSELQASELSLGAKRHDVRLEVRQKSREIRELDSAREVARLDLKLAQETLGITQTQFDQGQSSLRVLEQDRLNESEKWVQFLDADFARQQGQLTLLQATGQLAGLFQ